MDKRLTVSDITRAASGISEAEAALKELAALGPGAQIHWVVDANVASMFLSPRRHFAYSDVFARHYGKQSPTDFPLAALAAVLSGYIFSPRFGLAEGGSGPRILLRPHSDELHRMLKAIALKAQESAMRASEVLRVEKDFAESVRTKLDDFVKNREQSRRNFFLGITRYIIDKLGVILPEGPLDQLLRARTLLQNGQLAYENDEDYRFLGDLFEQAAVITCVEQRKKDWLKKINDLVEEDSSAPRHNPPDHQIDDDDRSQRNEDDAEVLAKIEYLNNWGLADSGNRRCFVLITAHHLLHRAIRRRNSALEGREARMHVFYPRTFLGSPKLLPTRENEVGVPSGHRTSWIRFTEALVVFEKRKASTHVTDQLDEHLQRVDDTWRALLDTAIPFAPASLAREKSARDVFVRLITEDEPRGLLEQEIYLALSHLFVALAELELDFTYQYTGPRPRRKPPPLRLSYYPEAEECILMLIESVSEFDLSRERKLEVGRMLKAVEAEQERSDKLDAASPMKYPLLLCLATRFAATGDWHAARVLATHAAAITQVVAAPSCVTGREAAFLECYCRCLEAKSRSDLGKAHAALAAFYSALQKERDWWNNEENRAREDQCCGRLGFDPVAEFPLHDARGEAEAITLELTEWMFDCFMSSASIGEQKPTEASVGEFWSRKAQSIDNLKARSIGLITTVDEFATSNYFSRSKPPSIDALVKFLRVKIAVCAAQLLVLSFFNTPAETERLAQSPLLKAAMNGLAQEGVPLPRMLLLLLRCIWCRGDDQQGAWSDLQKEDPDDHRLMPYDRQRFEFFREIARSALNQ